MFLFSNIHDWQDDTAVKQILVFPNQEMKTSFEETHAKLIAEQGIKDANDTGIGAIYKLRAVKDGHGEYLAIIRCGINGKMLWEDCLPYKTPNEALVASSIKLRNTILDNFNEMVSTIDCN